MPTKEISTLTNGELLYFDQHSGRFFRFNGLKDMTPIDLNSDTDGDGVDFQSFKIYSQSAFAKFYLCMNKDYYRFTGQWRKYRRTVRDLEKLRRAKLKDPTL